MRIGSKGIAIAKIGSKTVSVIRYGAMLVWQSVRSCFGSGMWIQGKPWIGEEAWKNDK